MCMCMELILISTNIFKGTNRLPVKVIVNRTINFNISFRCRRRNMNRPIVFNVLLFAGVLLGIYGLKRRRPRSWQLFVCSSL